MRPIPTTAGLALWLLIAGLQNLFCLQATPPQSVEGPESPRAPADDLLTRAASRYYSMVKENISAFDCAVHPEWLEVFEIANPKVYIRDKDPRVRLLDSVKITLHAPMGQEPRIVWEPIAVQKRPLTQKQTDLLDAMHKATEQTLMGFLQFWKPFMDGSAVPRTSQSTRVAPDGNGGYQVEMRHAGTTVVERFDDRLSMKEFDVKKEGARVDFAPQFASTPQGLLMTGFVARFRPGMAEVERAQVLRVGLDYADVEGVWIPSRLDMTLVGTGAFDFKLDGCRLTRGDKPVSTLQ